MGIFARALRILFRRRPMHVFVLIANEGEKVKECVVIEDPASAEALRKRLVEIWGGANVCMASRQVDDIPFLLRVLS